MEADIDEPDHVWLGGDVTVYTYLGRVHNPFNENFND